MKYEIAKNALRRYPLSLLAIAAVWVLSLSPRLPRTSLEGLPFIDKWTHLVMYGGTCTLLWWEYWRCHHRPDYGRLLLWAWLAPVAMSGLLELLQEWLTTNRHGEWADLAANTLGVTLAVVPGLLLWRLGRKR